MNILLKLCFLIFIPIGSILGDGIPVDFKTHRVTEPHTVLTLSESQSEEIEILGTLTLATEQWQKLRSIGPACPKRLVQILPVTWDDCTCETPYYVIQLSRSQVAVVHSVLVRMTFEDLELELTKTSNLKLYADRRGQFYFKGTLIPFSRLLQLIGASSGRMPSDHPEQQRWLCVELPLGIEPDSAVMKTRLDELFKTAEKAGWRTQKNQS